CQQYGHWPHELTF
nr:immunoglobulin light chain junction region [Macaca mulatta]